MLSHVKIWLAFVMQLLTYRSISSWFFICTLYWSNLLHKYKWLSRPICHVYVTGYRYYMYQKYPRILSCKYCLCFCTRLA